MGRGVKVPCFDGAMIPDFLWGGELESHILMGLQ